MYKDCKRRVEAGACTGEAGTEDPHQEARLALAECRQSCQDLINNNYSQSELPSIVQLYGGIEVDRKLKYRNISKLVLELCYRRFWIQISSL